jgi:hypothetical protein
MRAQAVIPRPARARSWAATHAISASALIAFFAWPFVRR